MFNSNELKKKNIKEIKCMLALGLKGDEYKQLMAEYMDRLKKKESDTNVSALQ